MKVLWNIESASLFRLLESKIDNKDRHSNFPVLFWDIPSPWWQASTVLVGTGSAISLLIAVTATAACCITYVIHSGNAKIAGSAQLLS
ncbi:hypothetical protein WA026_014086, partial [Henosepilachna vigintioctopunctata]